MIGTTPPGRGSWLLRLDGRDPVHDLAVETPCGARLLATGDDDQAGEFLWLYLNHLVDGPHEYVVVDCAAEPPDSDLLGRFDLVVEPEEARDGDPAFLSALEDAAGAREKDWAAYARQAALIHTRKARARGAAARDLLAQIDPGFVPGNPVRL